MNAGNSHCPALGSTVDVPTPPYEDPLDEDTVLDLMVVTTRRGLCRLTLLAAEVGSRFERDQEPIDPMAWLLAPRDLFGGKAAIEACLERENFMRALLLHGLAIGMDADPTDIDFLLDQNKPVCAPSDQTEMMVSSNARLCRNEAW